MEVDYKIFAFGGNGGKIVSCLEEKNVTKERLFYFDTDKTGITHSNIENKFQIGLDLLKGKSTNGNRKIGAEVFKADMQIFDNLIKDESLYTLIGGLGGGTFSGMIASFADLLYKRNRRFICIASFPFAFEERARHANSITTIKELNKYTDKVILLNPVHWETYDGEDGLDELYARMSNELADVIDNILNKGLEKEFTNENKWKENIIKAIELVTAYAHKTEYLVTTEESTILVARNLKALLTAFKEGVDITRNISPRKFEELVNYIYKISGHETELTQQTRDNGIDIKVFSLPPMRGNPFVTIVQAKQHAPHIKVGEAAIRDLAGTVAIQKADRGQLVTNSDFSRPAYKAASVVKIDLIKFYDLAKDAKELDLSKIDETSA